VRSQEHLLADDAPTQPPSPLTLRRALPILLAEVGNCVAGPGLTLWAGWPSWRVRVLTATQPV